MLSNWFRFQVDGSGPWILQHILMHVMFSAKLIIFFDNKKPNVITAYSLMCRHVSEAKILVKLAICHAVYGGQIANLTVLHCIVSLSFNLH